VTKDEVIDLTISEEEARTVTKLQPGIELEDLCRQVLGLKQ